MKIPFCLPLIDKDVNQEVLSCLNETGWLTTGPKVKLLEDEITELCQTSSTICVNSWTSGMLLLIRWLDLDEDDETGGEPDADEEQQYGGGQDPLDILKDFFPDASDERLQELAKFVSVIPTELYEAADPDAEMYSLMRQDRVGQLESQRDLAEERARGSLFRNLEQARGMEGKRGFALGRNIYGDVSEAAAQSFEGVQDSFGRGLFNINQSIIDRVSGAQRYLASLESQQKGDLLKLADLADLFKTDDDNGFTGSDDQDDYED